MWNRAETIVRAWKSAIAAAVAIVGISRRRSRGTGQEQPHDGEEGQAEVRQAIDQHPRLGIGLVEEHEVAEPAQAEPRYRHGSAARSASARRNRIRDRSGSETEPSRRLVGLRQGDVVDVAGLVAGLPERSIQPAQARRRSGRGARIRSTDARRPCPSPRSGAVALPEGIAERALDARIHHGPGRSAPARARSPPGRRSPSMAIKRNDSRIRPARRLVPARRPTDAEHRQRQDRVGQRQHGEAAAGDRGVADRPVAPVR